MNTTDIVRLQGLGLVNGKPAIDFVPGDVMVWNYGYTSTVRRVLKTTAKQVTFEIEYKIGEKTEISSRTLKKTRIVGMSDPRERK